MITKEILCVELSIHNKIHLFPQNNWQRISQEIILFTPSKIIFWPSLPDFGSIGRVEIVFSMYSYRLATFLSYNQLSKAILILSRVVGRVGGWVGGVWSQIQLSFWSQGIRLNELILNGSSSIQVCRKNFDCY